MEKLTTDLTDVSGRCVAVRTLMTARSVARAFDHALKSVGLTGTQFSLLVAIGAGQYGSISELGERLHIEKSTLSRNLRPLMDAGLIEKDESARGRSILLNLTDAGKTKLDEAYPVWQSVQARLEGSLGTDTLKSGFQFLAQLRDAARA